MRLAVRGRGVEGDIAIRLAVDLELLQACCRRAGWMLERALGIGGQLHAAADRHSVRQCHSEQLEVPRLHVRRKFVPIQFVAGGCPKRPVPTRLRLVQSELRKAELAIGQLDLGRECADGLAVGRQVLSLHLHQSLRSRPRPGDAGLQGQVAVGGHVAMAECGKRRVDGHLGHGRREVDCIPALEADASRRTDARAVPGRVGSRDPDCGRRVARVGGHGDARQIARGERGSLDRRIHDGPRHGAAQAGVHRERSGNRRAGHRPRPLSKERLGRGHHAPDVLRAGMQTSAEAALVRDPHVPVQRGAAGLEPRERRLDHLASSGRHEVARHRDDAPSRSASCRRKSSRASPDARATSSTGHRAVRRPLTRVAAP